MLYAACFDSFEHELIERLKARGTGRFSCWPEFERRLDAELGQLTGLYSSSMATARFCVWVENLVYGAFEAFKRGHAGLRPVITPFLPKVAGILLRMS